MITITAKAEEKIRELMQEDQDTIGFRSFSASPFRNSR